MEIALRVAMCEWLVEVEALPAVRAGWAEAAAASRLDPVRDADRLAELETDYLAAEALARLDARIEADVVLGAFARLFGPVVPDVLPEWLC